MSLSTAYGADGFTLDCAGVAIDVVAWDGAFPIQTGASMQLDPGALDAVSNDDPANWCATNAASPNFLAGDFGNPGVANPPCPVASPEVCDDQVDNDLDGVADCGDTDCIGDSACPGAGDVVISEVLYDAVALPDDQGDWFEVYNPTGTPWNLGGCVTIDDNGFTVEATFPLQFVVPAYGTATVATSGAPGFAPDGVSPGMTLNPPGFGADGFTIQCAGVDIDTVVWDGFTFPVGAGQSIMVEPGSLDATNNDDGANWCRTNLADPGYTSGDHGNPGVVNPACPVAAPETCADNIDNDLDGDTDCRDFDCVTDPACQEVCTGGLDEDVDGAYDCGDTDCIGDPACPVAGDLVISELQLDPVALADDVGEYIEITNGTATDFDLLGCESWDDNGFFAPDFVFDRSVVIPAGGVITIARSTTPGFAPSFAPAGFNLANGGGADGMNLECAGVEIDRVDFGFGWPVAAGFAMQLDPGSFDATLNDDPANWCTTNAASAGYTSGDYGNPGVVNPACPVAAPESCSDGVDNDLDLTVDCNDSDCVLDPVCAENCLDGLDDNGNGTVDCADPTCAGDPVCPVAGSVVIAEVMTTPQALSGDEGEWFELYNPGATDLNLTGCVTLDDGGWVEADLNTFLVVPAGGVVTVASSGTPGFTPTAVDPNMNLAQTFDGFTLSCGGVDIDTIYWDDTWPQPVGGSMALDAGSFDATANDDGNNWCPAAAAGVGFTSGDRGTPNLVNGACPVPVPEVCGDGIDNDLDGAADCSDADCGADPSCRVALTGCDPAWCTLTPGAGWNGGDLCECTIPPAFHPVVDTVEGSCFQGYGAPAPDLVISLDLTGSGYTEYAVDTCQVTPDDAAIAVFDADPLAGGNEVACNEDAMFEFSWCAKVTDPGNFGQGAALTPAPGSGEIWVVIDEFDAGDWWDGFTDRVIQIELN